MRQQEIHPDTVIRHRLITFEGAAPVLGCSPSALRQRAHRGDFPVVRIGRSVRIRSDVLAKLVEFGTAAFETDDR